MNTTLKPTPFQFGKVATSLTLILGMQSAVAYAEQPVPEVGDLETVERIMVTGQKIDRTLQETPNSVAVVTAQDMKDYNFNNLKDILDQTANVTSTWGGTGFTIRGISNTNVTGSGVADLATTFVDGAPVPREAILTGPMNIWDVQQVEILRGPQSTLQGRNTLAGAIMVKTYDPSYEWSGNTRIQYYDENEQQRFGVAVGGPIVDNQVAFRIAAETTEADGFVFNPTLNKYSSASESEMVRAKLLVEPKALPELRVLLSHTYDKRSNGTNIASFEEPSNWDNRLDYTNEQFIDESTVNLTVLQVDYELSDTWSLVSVSTYDETERNRFRDGDYSAVPNLLNNLSNNPESITTDLRFVHEGDEFSGVVGAYFSKLDNTDAGGYSRLTIYPESLGLGTLLVAPPQYGGFGLDPAIANMVMAEYAQGVKLDSHASSPIEIETYALYADFTWQYSDKLRYFAGFRYDNETQEQGNFQSLSLASELPEPAAYGPLAPIFTGINAFLLAEVANANGDDSEADTEFDAFLPKLGVSYDVQDNVNLSFIAQRGYRSGGTGINPARAEVFTFDQEFTWNYELSLRSEWLDGDMTFNANLFYIDWKDQQVTVYLSESIYDTETKNVGSSSVKGGEIELNYFVNDNFKIYASYGYSKTEIDEFYALVDEALVNLEGNEFAQAPQHTFSMGGVFSHDNGFFASVNFNYVGESYERLNLDQSNDEEIVPSRTLVNAKVGYRGEQYGVYLTGSNLFDEEYYHNDFMPVSGVEHGRYGDPRVVGVVLEASF